MQTTILLGAVLLIGGIGAAPVKGAPALRGLLFNLDCTDFFYNHHIAAGIDGGAVLDQYIDTIAEAGATALMCNTNARKTSYESDVWESFWEGYDPAGPDDQPYWAAVPKEEIPAYRAMIHAMYALDQQGVDYPARIAARCRQRDVSPWISLRMNDVHFNDNLDHPFHGKLWRDPKYHRGGSMAYYARGLDYAHPEVRDLYRALIVETLQRYDIDGLELDFMREPYLFREGAEQEGARILSEWLKDIRGLTQEAAARRGHPVRLAVRVPSRVEVARGWGLDAVAWAKAGLVDLVVATPRWATLEFDMPMAEWKQALAGTEVTLAGGLEILIMPWSGAPRRSVTPEQARGAATAVLHGGADCAYVFNYFPDSHWPRAEYLRTLNAMSSLAELEKLPRRHAITWRDILAPGEHYTPPLPATGANVSLELPTGPKPAEGATVTLELQVKGDATAQAPAAQVNGAACSLQKSEPKDAGVLFVYAVPTAALPGKARDRITVAAGEGQSVTVEGLEIHIAPPGTQE